LWDARVRLYPSRNGCEKSALFTPQLFDMQELGFLGAALDRRLAEGGAFTFVDVGANVGIYSIFVAARGGDRARCLAIEPQPGIVDRARFNFAANPALKIEIIPMAIADHDGSVDMIINRRDSGGSHIRSGSAAAKDAELVRVPCRPLGAMLAEAGISTIDAIKIDIEGAEHLALAPLLNEAPRDLLPRLVLIEDRPSDWPVDLYAALAQRGYSRLGRGKVNMLFSLP
jgi:FkbM family methyltransferase